jgi:hypothetical protein
VNDNRNFPDFEKMRGGPVPLEEVARLERLARRTENLSVTGGEGTLAQADEGGLSVVLPPEPSGWGLVTGEGPYSGSYTFTELQDDGGTPPLFTVGSGAYQGVAVENDGNPYVPFGELGVGAVVRVWRADGEHWRFRFDGVGVTDSSPPAAPLAPGKTVLDVLLQLVWVSLGIGPGGTPLWLALCPCIPGPGSGSGSGSGGGPAGSDLYYTPCCPGVGLGTRLSAVLAGGSCPERAYTLARHLGTGLDAWDTLPTDGGGPDTYGECSGDVWSVRCEGGVWQLIFQANPAAFTFPARSASCSPFQLIFDVPDLCGCGAAVMTVIKAP